MALLFNGLANPSGNYVNHGSAASLDSLDSLTIIWWDFPNTVATGNGRAVYKFSAGAGIQVWSSVVNAGAARLFHGRATTGSDVFMAASTRQVSTWNFNAVTDSDGVAGKFYWGSLSSPVADVTDTGATVTGAGAENSHAALNFEVGGGSAPTSVDARTAYIWTYNRVLPFGEIQLHQYRPGTILSGCVLYCVYGFNGTGTQPDWSGSGNAGTLVNSPTVADHVPLGPLFGFDLAWDVGWTPIPPTPTDAIGLFDPHLRPEAWFDTSIV